jgi:hypothetical protein
VAEEGSGCPGGDAASVHHLLILTGKKIAAQEQNLACSDVAGGLVRMMLTTEKRAREGPLFAESTVLRSWILPRADPKSREEHRNHRRPKLGSKGQLLFVPGSWGEGGVYCVPF